MKEIPLNHGKVALVDDEDYVNLSKYKWRARNPYKQLWYAVRDSSRKLGKPRTISMHVEIMGTPKGRDTDHINGDGLDNRRENLRVCTHRENGQNRHQIKTSKYPGVSWEKYRRKWRAAITVNGKTNHIGLFEVEEDAAVAYQQACENLNIEAMS